MYVEVLRGKRVERVILFAVLVIISIAMLFPFLWMLFTSFKPEADVVTWPPRLFPRRISFKAYKTIWHDIPFLQFFFNTIVFAGGVTLSSLILDSFSAYAFARLDFPGKDALFAVILVTLMVPFHVVMIPVFSLLHQFGWINTYAGLMIPRASNAFGIFFLRQFFRGIPRELEDAAFVDGANTWWIYSKIILPLSKPALATLAVFHFMYNWNDFLWPLIVTTSVSMRTLPTGLALFMGKHVVEYASLMAGVVLSLLPVTIAYLSAQQHFVRGIALTGLKG